MKPSSHDDSGVKQKTQEAEVVAIPSTFPDIFDP
jgi:hypothetical protein